MGVTETPNAAAGRKLTWLVTGGCGFIGTSLVRALLQQGLAHRVCILDNLSVGSREALAAVTDYREISVRSAGDEGGVYLLVGDIRDAETAARVCRAVDVVVHLAAMTGVGPSVEDPREDMDVNVVGTFNVLQGARVAGVRRFVFASSGAPVGEVEPPVHEEQAPHPVSPYGASKLAGEGYCSAYFRTYGLETVVLRFGNVYGPGSMHKSSVVAKFIRRAIQGLELEIFGDGSQTRDFIYVDDLIDAIVASARVPGIGGEIFQIATSRETTVEEMAVRLVRVFSKRGYPDVRLTHSEWRAGDIRRNFSDTTKAKGRLGWQARVFLDEGLTRTVDWYLSS